MLKFLFTSFLFTAQLTAYSQETMHVGFYSDWEPIMYSENRNPSHLGFNHIKGFYKDLFLAWQSISDAQVQFNFTGIKEWDQIWFSVVKENIDIVCGISILEERTRNAEGQTLIRFTDPHLFFRQSLLIRREDANRIANHFDLNAQDHIGAVPGTTGETAMLERLGIIRSMDSGILSPGTKIQTKSKYIVTTGAESIFDETFSDRIKLYPANDTQPQIIYRSGEDLLIPDLESGLIDAIARGEIGNQLVADQSPGKYQVVGHFPESQNDSKIEKASCVIDARKDDLFRYANHWLKQLTKNGRISYQEWKKDPEVFMKRARKLNTINGSDVF